MKYTFPVKLSDKELQLILRTVRKQWNDCIVVRNESRIKVYKDSSVCDSKLWNQFERITHQSGESLELQQDKNQLTLVDHSLNMCGMIKQLLNYIVREKENANRRN